MKTDYTEKLKKEIAEMFEAGLRADELRKRPLTTEEKAEVLFAVALRKMQ